MTSTDAPIAAPPPSSRLKTWLIVVTILAGIGLIAAIPSILFGTYMAAFAADDPSSVPADVVNLMITVWAVGAGYIVLLIAGIAGGWIAYRKRRNRLSFGLSWLAAGPIFLVILAIVALVLLNIFWTAAMGLRGL